MVCPKSQTSFIDSLFDALDDRSYSSLDYLEKAAQVFPSDTGKLIDGYFNGELSVVVYGHARDVLCNSELQEVAFVFQHVVAGDRTPVEDMRRRGNADYAFNPFGHAEHDMQPPVSIFASTIMQNSESASNGIEVLGLSVVRLYKFDPLPKFLREFADIPTKFSFRVVIENGEDRKLPLAFIGGRFATIANDGGSVYGPVKSGSELIKEFAKDECEVILHGAKKDGTKQSCPIVVHLYGEGMGVFAYDTVPYLMERIAMRICPVNSLPAVFEPGIHPAIL